MVQPADCLVVLGNKAYPDGTLSNRLKDRVDKAFELYKKGFAKKIIVSGGINRIDWVPEGTMLKIYLVKKGIDPNDVIIDNYGSNTYMTAMNFKKLGKRYHFNSVIVVSQFYHITRTKFIFRKK